MITIAGCTDAYKDCRKKKRKTANATKFELDYENNIVQLVREVNNRTYYPSRSIAFVVTRPKYREVFAADFRDRILHHYIALRIVPIMEQLMSSRSYSCREGKGTLAGVEQLKEDIRIVSNDYKENCYVVKVDIQGFFMNIDRMKAAKMMDELIVNYYVGDDKEDLRWLTWILINHAPEKNCILQSPRSMWRHIPKEKSLFTNGEGLGMPIGNLLSQTVANYYVDVINKIAERHGIRAVRYVDDMALVSKNKQELFKAISEIREALKNLGLTLHPDKFYMQNFPRGVTFTGAVIKEDRSYVINRTVHSFEESVRALEMAETKEEIQSSVCRVNSYLGTLIHHNTYAIRRGVLNDALIYDKVVVCGHFKKVVLKKKYNERRRIRREIKEGKFAEITTLASPVLAVST